MKYIYVIRNRKIAAYLDPFFKVEDKQATQIELQRFCILEKEGAKKNHFDESELYCLGTYNDEKGTLELYEEPEFLCDLGQYFPKE